MQSTDTMAFQRRHVGPDGKALTVDGILGPKTRWALQLQDLPSWRQTLVMNALAWVGHTETSPNSSVEIDQWLGACGVQPGNPWCAAFVSAMLRSIGVQVHEASVQRLVDVIYDDPKQHVDYPLPGDLSYWLNQDGTGHVGIVTAANLTRVSLVEGNSGNAVRAGLRYRDTLSFVCPMADSFGLPEVDLTLPALGSATR